jgi:hypothetical protein
MILRYNYLGKTISDNYTHKYTAAYEIGLVCVAIFLSDYRLYALCTIYMK